MHDLESQRTSLDEKTLTGTINTPANAGLNNPAAADAKDVQTDKKVEAKEVPAEDIVYPVTDLDKGIVGWDIQDDPANPQNFTKSRKWGLLALLSSMTLISSLASSMFAPALSDVAVDLKVTNEVLLSFTVTIYMLGYTVSLHQPLV
jgi:hypothetical protein